MAILKAAAGEPIPLYGDGLNVRDWLYVEDHVDALLLAATRGIPGRAYCVGGSGSTGTASERTNKQVVEAICSALDDLLPATVRWYLDNLDWCQRVRQQGGCSGGRLGVVAGA